MKDMSLSKALRFYIGHGSVSYPQLDWARVEMHMDIDETVKQRLDAIIDSVKDPDWATQSYEDYLKDISECLAKNYPELDDDAVAAVEWYYSWQYK